MHYKLSFTGLNNDRTASKILIKHENFGLQGARLQPLLSLTQVSLGSHNLEVNPGGPKNTPSNKVRNVWLISCNETQGFV